MTEMVELPRRILDNENYRSLFSAEELAKIEKQAGRNDVDLPPLLLNNDWDISLITYTRTYITVYIF